MTDNIASGKDTWKAPRNEGPGGYIDTFKILQQIGEGGYGAVFEAEQQSPVRRRVALKVIALKEKLEHCRSGTSGYIPSESIFAHPLNR